MNINEQLIYDVARLYYSKDLSQIEISKKLGISRPKVSRLLAKARQEGIVEIKINAPNADASELERLIKEKFELKDVLVVPSLSDDSAQNLNQTAKVAAPFFQRLISNGDKIGVSWGYTLLKIAENLYEQNLPNSVILQISGNLDNADSSNFANKIVRYFSDKMSVNRKYTLPCPVIVENSIIVDLLLHDSKISSIMNQANDIDVVFPNIGVLSEDNCLWRTGYLSTSEIQTLHKQGTVGCICSRFIDIQGNIVDTALDERTISLSPQSLKKAKYSCVCIANENKVLPLLGCLRAGLVSVVALDSLTATLLLKYSENY